MRLYKINPTITKSQMMLMDKKEFIDQVKYIKKEFMALEPSMRNANKREMLKRLYQWACKYFHKQYDSYLEIYL